MDYEAEAQKPGVMLLQKPTPALPLCMWSALDIGGGRPITVASSHHTNLGSVFILRLKDGWNDYNTFPRKLLCADGETNTMELADPRQNNHFDVRMIVCNPGVALHVMPAADPERPSGCSSPPRERTHERPLRRCLVCLAPLYEKDNVRWLIEWLELHKAMGVDAIQVPLYDKDESSVFYKVLKRYEKEGFIMLTDWSPGASGGVTHYGQIYERGKILAWNRCYLENLDIADWMLFIDIDEVWWSSQGLHFSLAWMDLRFMETGKAGFSARSVTVTSVFRRVPPTQRALCRLLLDIYDSVEAKPFCPANCGRYHHGREKYALRGRGSKELVMLWTHAIGGLDYSFADAKMELLGEEMATVRHYQGWWYEKNEALSPEALKRRDAAFPSDLIERVKANIIGDRALHDLYLSSPNKGGLSWIHVHEAEGVNGADGDINCYSLKTAKVSTILKADSGSPHP